MKFYRVSELVNPVSHESLPMIVAAVEGKKIHAALGEVHKGRGKFIEQLQLCYLTKKVKDKSLSPILGVLCGHPDFWWLSWETLHVVDWKTIPSEAKPVVKSWWWDQVTLYALMILTNNPFIKVRKVSLELWVYNRKKTIEETISNCTHHKRTVSPSNLKTQLSSWLVKKIENDWLLVSHSSGMIQHD